MSTRSSGLHILHDSGAPNGSDDYTTVVIIHGYGWHSGTFEKLLPLAERYNARVVLVNRRDFPGARPYSEDERAQLPVLADDAGDAEITAGKEKIEAWMKERAREVYDLLVGLVTTEALPPALPDGKAGGIVVAGWSFGCAWMTALLAHVASFEARGAKLDAYVRSVVLFDPPFHTIGYPPPASAAYHPVSDSEIAPEDWGRVFSDWVSGYYDHGDTLDTLEQKTPLRDPLPTFSTLSPEELARTQYLPPGQPGGSDATLYWSGIRLGLFKTLREGALYLPRGGASGTGASGEDLLRAGWPQVEVRYVYCERSEWEIPWATWSLRREMEDAKRKGIPMRNVRMVHIRGANHFVSWDNPEFTIRALVRDEDEVA